MAGQTLPIRNDRLVSISKRWVRRNGSTIGPFSPTGLVASGLRRDDDVSQWELGSWTKAADDPLARIFADAAPSAPATIDHWRAYSPRNTHTVIEFSGNPAGIACIIDTYHQVSGSGNGGRLIARTDGTFILDEIDLNGEQLQEFCAAMRGRFHQSEDREFEGTAIVVDFERSTDRLKTMGADGYAQWAQIVFDHMLDVARASSGMKNLWHKPLGDGILIVLGVARARLHAQRAVNTAIDLFTQFSDREQVPPLRVGVASGALVTRFHHPKIYQFSQEVYGEPIVIATRLQSSAKNQGGALRIADSTYGQLPPDKQSRFSLVPGQPIAPDYPETRVYECEDRSAGLQ